MPTKYVYCDNHCKYPALDKEEVLSAIQQALENGGVQNVNPEKPFITKIVDKNTGEAVSVWLGTEAQFNALSKEQQENGTLYIYSTDFEKNVNDLLEEILSGAKVVGNAQNAQKVNNLEIKQDANGVLSIGDIVIPQHVKIYDFRGAHECIFNSLQNVELDASKINLGDCLRFVIQLIHGSTQAKQRTFYIHNFGGLAEVIVPFENSFSSSTKFDTITVQLKENKLILKSDFTTSTGGWDILTIYKVIE